MRIVTIVKWMAVGLASLFIAACGQGRAEKAAETPAIETPAAPRPTSSLSVRLVQVPSQFDAPFCVRIRVSATDFGERVSDRTLPAGTNTIETVVPNIPVGAERVVELGIFESGTCGDLATAEWYGKSVGVAVTDGGVTLVAMDIAHRNSSAGVGSIIIRGNRTILATRLHGEVVNARPAYAPLSGATCDIYENNVLIGSTVTGAAAADLGVFNANIEVDPATNELSLRCRRAGFRNAVQLAAKLVDTVDPRRGTFAATVRMVAGVSVSVLGSGASGLSARLVLPTVQLRKVDTVAGAFDQIQNDDEAFTLAGGGMDNFSTAETPVYTTYIALPLGSDLANVSITPEGQGTELPARLYPIQKPMRDAAGATPDAPPPVDDESFKFDQAVYQRAATDVRKPLSIRPVGGSEDVNIFEVKMHLLDFDPAKQLLRTYPALAIKVDFAGKCFRRTRVADGFALDTIDNLDENVYRHLPVALNAEMLNLYVCPEIIEPIFLGARMIIVTAPEFATAASALRVHKIAHGISTVVVTTTGINPAAAASATDIKNYLQNAYNHWWVRPRWVLFMGDAEFIPTHYDLNNAWDSAKNAGDMWYGQFTASATAFPVFGMGRVPVDTAAQAQSVVDKIIAFETAPPNAFSSYYYRETFAAQFQDNNLDNIDDRWFAETSEHIRDYQISLGMSVQRIYSAPAASNPTWWNGGAAIPAYLRKPAFPWNGSTADIINAVNGGTSLLYHRDHGWWWGWGTPGFSTANLPSVNAPGTAQPVVYSINCASGIFDNETVDLPANIIGGGYGTSASGVYWAEEFLRKTDGAIAVIGDTRSSATTLNNDMAKGLFDATWPAYLPYTSTPSSIRKLGDVLNHAKGYVASLGYDPTSTRQELQIYNLLGDPTVSLKTRPPLIIVVAPTRELSQIVLSVRPQPPCLTCPMGILEPIVAVATGLKGEVLARGVVVNGQVALDIGQYGGDVTVTVSGVDVITNVIQVPPLVL
ncbi:MAG: C25 family cysteine peptidase [Pseudomonadota bacterium]